MKTIKTIVITILSIIALVIIAGIIKFNFSDSDIIISEVISTPTNSNTVIATTSTTTTIVKPIVKPTVNINLTSKTWKLSDTTYKNYDRFSLTFKKDNTVSITTDCNGMGGNYSVSGDKLIFSQMISTLMYCEGSSEQDFAQKISTVYSYSIDNNVLTLRHKSGELKFR